MRPLALFLALSLATISSTFAGPKIDIVTSISIRNAEFAVVCVLETPAEIDALVSRFRRAKSVSVSSDRNAFPYKIDIDARWLYDAEQGDFMLLSKAEQPVFRLSEEDRAYVNALIKKGETNKVPEPTA